MHEIFFAFYMGLQELNDTSYTHQLIMKSKYTQRSLILGTVFGHIFINFVFVTFFWIFFSHFDFKSVKLLGCFILYYVITYELMFNSLANMAVIMELKK